MTNKQIRKIDKAWKINTKKLKKRRRAFECRYNSDPLFRYNYLRRRIQKYALNNLYGARSNGELKHLKEFVDGGYRYVPLKGVGNGTP